MKKLLLTLVLSPIVGFSQNLTPEVISSSGDYFTATSTQLSWTLGEISIETYSGSSNQLTQGFHQTYDVPGSINQFTDNIIVNAYPNPFTTSISIEIPDNNELININIYDAVGNQVMNYNYSGSSPKNIDFSDLASGVYLIEFSSNEGPIKTIKVQKL